MSGNGTKSDCLQVISWGVASIPMKGQNISGDLHFVKGVDDGCLVAAIDGLGHGYAAAYAAEKAAAVLEKHATESLITLMRYSHEQLRETRGVTMSIAKMNSTDDTMTWLGIGNVEGVLIRSDRGTAPIRESVINHGGVIGYQMPMINAVVTPIAPGDTLILATDGIDNEFADEIDPCESPQCLAETISKRYAKKIDDALVLVVRYRGRS